MIKIKIIPYPFHLIMGTAIDSTESVVFLCNYSIRKETFKKGSFIKEVLMR